MLGYTGLGQTLEWKDISIEWRKVLIFNKFKYYKNEISKEDINEIRNLNSITINNNFNVNDLEGLLFLKKIDNVIVKEKVLKSLRGSEAILENTKITCLNSRVEIDAPAFFSKGTSIKGLEEFDEMKGRIWLACMSDLEKKIIKLGLNIDDKRTLRVSDLEQLLQKKVFKIELNKNEFDDTNCNVECLPFLRCLTSLRALVLNKICIKSLRFLKRLKKLRLLSCANACLDDLAGIEVVKNLEVLDISYNNISDIKMLEELSNLRVVVCEGNSIEDASPISSLGNVRILDLSFNKLYNLFDVQKLHKLNTVVLNYNSIMSLDKISENNSIKTFYITGNRISDLSPLANLKNVTSLSIGVNNVSDVSPVSKLEKLESLFCEGNKIRNLSPLVKCKELSYLEAGRNEIVNIDFTKNLEKLKVLSLQKNKIERLPTNWDNGSIKELWISENPVQLLSGVADLPSLEILSISHMNMIKELPNVREIEYLKKFYFFKSRVDPHVKALFENQWSESNLLKTLNPVCVGDNF